MPTAKAAFSEPHAAQKLLAYVDKQLAAGVPRERLIREARTQLLDAYRRATNQYSLADYLADPSLSHSENSFHDMYRRVSAVLTRIATDMGRRCLEGRELERLGRIDEAIELYQANIRDLHVGTMSYDRLRIIHTRRKEYAAAAAACEAYIALPWPEVKGKDQFRNHLGKLKAKAGESLLPP